MSSGLPRLNITVTPRLHAQVQALAKSREETVSDLLRRAIESCDERRALHIERKSKALSVRVTEAHRAKLARIAKRAGLPPAACMTLLLDHLARTLADPAESEHEAPTPAVRRRQRQDSKTVQKQPAQRRSKSSTATKAEPAKRQRQDSKAVQKRPAQRQRKGSTTGKEQPLQGKRDSSEMPTKRPTQQKTPTSRTSRAQAHDATQTPSTRTRSTTNTAPAKAARTKRASQVATEPPALDLPSFARIVQNIADAEVEGRFGARKVFISSVWRRLAGTPLAGMHLDDFKRALVAANRANLLALERADLIAAMDPVKVKESETPYLNTRFHFIESPRHG